MNRTIVALAALSIILIPAFAKPAIVPYAGVSAGPILTAESGYASLVSAAGNAGLGLGIGPAYLEAGAGYHAPSAYGADWYRYRGFFAAYATAGLTLDLGLVSGFVGAGLALARYDLSQSYFAFPYLEPGVKIHTARLGASAALSLRASLPVELRADALSVGLRLGAVLSPTGAKPSTTGTRD